MAAAERPHKGPGIAILCRCYPLQRQGCQLQAHDPALRAGAQRGDVLWRQVQSHRLVEKGSSFRRGEAEVIGADLDNLVTRAPPGQRPGRVSPAGDHQVHLRWQVLQEKDERFVNLRVGDDVQVVENQGKGLGDLGDLIEQLSEQRFAGEAARRLEHIQHGCA